MKIIKYLPLLVIVALVTWGCSPVSGSKTGGGDSTSGAEAVLSDQPAEDPAPLLCGGCGQVKGTAACCDADAETCGGCGLAKGSPGCCKIEKGTDVKLCADCGQIAGSDACCAKDAVKCGGCGLAKGSPGCCKIKL